MEWLTYREAAAALGLPSPSAAKYRAMRGRWPKHIGNDGLARIQLPEHSNPVRTRSATGASAEGAERDPGSHQERTADATGAHPEFVEAIKALRDQLAAAVERETRLAADLAAERLALANERERTGKAIEAFAQLADRLDAFALERARPWWRRLVG